MNRRLDRFIRDRAEHRCEYCHYPQSAHPQRFPIDHIIPRKHGGRTDRGNLALCCPFCNWHKGPNLTGIDDATGTIAELFHARRNHWADHFQWNGYLLIGKTPTGRATIAVMNINDSQRIQLRELLPPTI